MVLRKLSTVLAVVAVGAAGGMIGTSLAANAGAPKASTSDKTLYGKANPDVSDSMDQPGGTASTVLEVSIHAPAAGTASLDINSIIWADFPDNTGNGNTLVEDSQIGRCSAPDSLSTSPPTNCANVVDDWFEKPAYSSTATDATYPYAINSLISFSGESTKTLYINVKAESYPSGLIGGAHVQVAFTPNHAISSSAHITVSASAPHAPASAKAHGQ